MSPSALPAASGRRRLLKPLGYVAFGLFSLVLGFFLTFPYDALKERARQEAALQGYVLRLGSLGPGLLTVRATDVQVAKRADTEPPPEALKLDSISVGPSFWPPGAKVTVRGLGGTLTAALGGLGAVRVKVDAEDLDLAKGNLKGFTGVDLAGGLQGHVDLSLPRVGAEADLTQATGTLALDGKGLTVNGGTLSLVIPQFGPEPTPLDLPRIAFGDLTGKVKVEKGLGTVEELKAKGSDLEALVGGTVKLGKRVEYSESNLEVRFKPDPEFQKRLGLIGSALSVVPADPKDPTWRLGHLTGLLGRPQFR